VASQGRRQGAEPASISSIKEATIFSSAVGPSKDLRERDLDAAMSGKARDARVVPREGKGGDGACRRAARVSPCPWGDHEEARATYSQGVSPAADRRWSSRRCAAPVTAERAWSW